MKIKINKNSEPLEHVTFTTKQILIEANDNGFNIKLSWISGYAGITGNEKADLLATVGRTLNVPYPIKTEKREHVFVINKGGTLL